MSSEDSLPLDHQRDDGSLNAVRHIVTNAHTSMLPNMGENQDHIGSTVSSYIQTSGTWPQTALVDGSLSEYLASIGRMQNSRSLQTQYTSQGTKVRCSSYVLLAIPFSSYTDCVI